MCDEDGDSRFWFRGVNQLHCDWLGCSDPYEEMIRFERRPRNFQKERGLTLSIVMPVVSLDIGAIGDRYDFLIGPNVGHGPVPKVQTLGTPLA